MTKVVIFCDRCSREITDTKYGWLSHMLSFDNPDRKDEWRYEEDKYLCPQCKGNFIQWYKKGVN